MKPLMGALAAAALVGVVGMTASDRAMAQGKGPNVGDKAPTFVGLDDQGKPWKSADHVGKNVLVFFFYPADFTGG